MSVIPRPSWDETWLHVAEAVGARSLCSRDKVGAVVVSASNRILDTGYNGPPAGFETNAPCFDWCPRSRHAKNFVASDYSDCPSLHAEANALMFSDRRLREGGTIYVSSGTCNGCAKLVANSGLRRAVYRDLGQNPHRGSNDHYDFLRDCGLTVDLVRE